MASRRVGIDNSSTGKAVQKASGLSNALFGGPTPQIVEEKKEEPKVEEKVEEVKEVVKED